ncbi:MAG: peptidoglycan-binding domain-containing protein, partial [Minisyncoccia bacterium]
AAVTKFQEMMELTADGLAGVTTQGKLAEVLLGNMTKTETEKKPKTKTTTASEAKTEKDSDVIANADIVNMELKKVLNRAKTEVNSFVNGTLNYTDAHSLVVGYNNEILEIYSKADPLYKSSFGGKYFVYFAQLTNGSYVCVDNSVNPLTEKISAPDLNVEKIEC